MSLPLAPTRKGEAISIGKDDQLLTSSGTKGAVSSYRWQLHHNCINCIITVIKRHKPDGWFAFVKPKLFISL